MRTKPRRPSFPALWRFGLAIVFLALGGAIAAASPRWQRTNAAARAQGVAIAVCLPGERNCLHRRSVAVIADDFDFIEMIAGDWLAGPTRTQRRPARDDERDGDRRGGVARNLNLPVSRGPIDRAFLLRIARPSELAGRSSAVGLRGDLSARRIRARPANASANLRQRAEPRHRRPPRRPGAGFEWPIPGSISRSRSAGLEDRPRTRTKQGRGPQPRPRGHPNVRACRPPGRGGFLSRPNSLAHGRGRQAWLC